MALRKGMELHERICHPINAPAPGAALEGSTSVPVGGLTLLRGRLGSLHARPHEGVFDQRLGIHLRHVTGIALIAIHADLPRRSR